MLKENFMVPLAAVLFAAVVFFASTEVMAACDNCAVQTTCTLVDAKNGSPYPDSTNPIVVTALPPEQLNGAVRWCYKTNAYLSGNNQFVLLAPKCCPELGYNVDGGGQVIAPGGGDPTTLIGKGNFQEWVIRLAEEQPDTYCFYTKGLASTSNGSGQFKIGKDIAYCKNIAVPACGSNANVTSSKITTSSGKTFCVQGDVVVNCDTGEELPSVPLSDLTLNGSPLTFVELPGLGNQAFIIEDAGDHSTYYCSRTGRCYY